MSTATFDPRRLLAERAIGVLATIKHDGRPLLTVTTPEGWSWATAEGTVTLSGPGTDPFGPEVDARVTYYRLAAGEHPDWDEYRAVMVTDRRVLITMPVDIYGAVVNAVRR